MAITGFCSEYPVSRNRSVHISRSCHFVPCKVVACILPRSITRTVSARAPHQCAGLWNHACHLGQVSKHVLPCGNKNVSRRVPARSNESLHTHTFVNSVDSLDDYRPRKTVKEPRLGWTFRRGLLPAGSAYAVRTRLDQGQRTKEIWGGGLFRLASPRWSKAVPPCSLTAPSICRRE